MQSPFARFADEFKLSRALLAERGLCEFEEAASLVVAEVEPEGREHRLVPQAAQAWHRMKLAASRDGISIFIVSAFRGVERQAEIVREKLGAGMPLHEILAQVAPPGCSEHHTGRAVDISAPDVPPIDEEFATTPAFAWLATHAADFGFRMSYPAGNLQGYQYEPWHWCWHGA